MAAGLLPGLRAERSGPDRNSPVISRNVSLADGLGSTV